MCYPGDTCPQGTSQASGSCYDFNTVCCKNNTIPPAPAICGNGICEGGASTTCYPSAESCYPGGENCSNCPADCGVCNYTPIGNFDVSNYTNFAGWTCDANNYNASLQVDFYADGSYIGSGKANGQREQAVANLCGGNPNHGFSFNPQLQFGLGNKIFDGNNHAVTAYAINTPTGSNPSLGTITITNADPVGNFDGASYTNFYGWACDNDDSNQTLTISFYLDGTNKTGTYIGNTMANVQRNDVASSCGNNANHGFTINPGIQFANSALFDGNPHIVYAYASNWPAGNSLQLQHGTNGGNISIIPFYTISGQVFIDYNLKQKPDYSSPQYASNSGTIVIKDSNNSQVGSTIAIDNTGAYTTGETIPKGTYTVNFIPDPNFVDTYTTTVPTTLTVKIGDSSSGNLTCNVGTSQTASCADNSDGFNGSIQHLDFGLTPYYTISGIIYDDLNLDTYYSPTDQNGNTVDTIITTGTVTASGSMNATAPVGNNGSYQFAGHTNGLVRGTYTLTYNPTGSTQRYIYPPNYQTQITVGKPGVSSITACNSGNNHTYDFWNGSVQTVNAVCDADGNITSAARFNNVSVGNLNFGINDAEIFNQTTCLDMRQTSLTDHVPASGMCGGVTNAYSLVTDQNRCPVSPGIAFCQDGTCDFGNGQASVNDWQVGSASYPELFQPVNGCIIRTSVAYFRDTVVQNNIQATDLTTICPLLSNCTLPDNLPNGIYTATGDVTINSYTFPQTAGMPFSSTAISPSWAILLFLLAQWQHSACRTTYILIKVLA